MPTSKLTQKAISTSFKLLMTQKPFEKITIKDITDLCSLNRQTFYYHYQDKYELLNWIYTTEIIEPYIHDINIDNFNTCLFEMFVTMKKDEHFYKNAFSCSNEEFKNYLTKTATNIFESAGKRLQEKADYSVPEDDLKFISQFFAFGISGTIINWVNTGMKESPTELANYLKNLVDDCHKISIDRYIGTL